MSLDVRTEDGIVILTPKGMLLGGNETEELEEKVKELDGNGNEKLLINLGKSTFMSTPGISVMFCAYTKYVKRGARVKLCCIDRSLHKGYTRAAMRERARASHMGATCGALSSTFVVIQPWADQCKVAQRGGRPGSTTYPRALFLGRTFAPASKTRLAARDPR